MIVCLMFLENTFSLHLSFVINSDENDIDCVYLIDTTIVHIGGGDDR